MVVGALTWSMILFASVRMDGRAKLVTHVNINAIQILAVTGVHAMILETPFAAYALQDGKEPLVILPRTAAVFPTPVQMVVLAWATEIPSLVCVKKDGRGVPARRIPMIAIPTHAIMVEFVLMVSTGFAVNAPLVLQDLIAGLTSMNASLPLVATVPLV